eukprot:3132754-Rhodomonas_salina.4
MMGAHSTAVTSLVFKLREPTNAPWPHRDGAVRGIAAAVTLRRRASTLNSRSRFKRTFLSLRAENLNCDHCDGRIGA